MSPEDIRNAESMLRHLMRMRTTGVFAPKVATKTSKLKDGKELVVGTSLK